MMDKRKLTKRVFTFGFGQPHEGKYHVIWGENEADCRNLMFERFGDKWSRMYKTEEEAGVKEFNLIELK